MPLRILINGDRIYGSSAYSKVVNSMCQTLIGMGHSVAHVPMGVAMRGGKFGYQNVLIYPSGNDPWNEDVIVDRYTDYRADMLISVKDAWVFNHTPSLALNWVPSTAVDHSPVSPSITSRLHTCFKVIAISRFGQRELRAAGVENVEYIPYDMDTSIYKPLGKKAECRKLFYLDPDPDEFIVGIIAMNRVRKMIPRMLRGYARFIELNPNIKSHLWLWTDVAPTQATVVGDEETPTSGVSDSGVNLLPEIMELGIGEKVRWPEWRDVQRVGGLPEWNPDPSYMGGWDMVKMYNCLDVLLGCTGGEGFFLPGIEAQACGVPIVVTDYSATPEICGAGLTVRASDYVVVATPGIRYALADIDGMADALTKIYNANREKLAKRARAFTERYSRENVLNNYWKPFMEKCEIELKPHITREGIKPW